MRRLPTAVLAGLLFALATVPWAGGAAASHGGAYHVTERVSVASDGTQSPAPPFNGDVVVSIDASGQVVAFSTLATDLVEGDSNQAQDVFVHDRRTGETTRVSVASDGTQANSFSFEPELSADGRFVVFGSDASNLVPGDDNGTLDVFLHDRVTGDTTLLSRAGDGTAGNALSSVGGAAGGITPDGRFVSFGSFATDLVPGDTNGVADVFLHDRVTGETTLVSVASDGAQGNDHASGGGSLSADGRLVAFNSFASNLVPGDTNDTFDGFVHDRVTGQTTRVTVADDGSQPNQGAGISEISADGTAVVFQSTASNLVPGDTNDRADVFLRDLVAGETTRISVGPDGQEASGAFPRLSGDGRFVVYLSFATTLVPQDTNGNAQVYVYDRRTGQTQLASVAQNGAAGNAIETEFGALGSESADINGDGSVVVFSSWSTNLVPNDTNETVDVFVSERAGGVEPPPAGRRCTLEGTPGDDVLRGTAGADVICASGGDDVVYAGAGDDIVYGGRGDDRLFGGRGDDRLRGNDGDDVLRGNTGHDRLLGDRGVDRLRGDAGADRLHGGLAADDLRGGSGADRLFAGAGADRVFGDDGDDRLFGNDGDDLLHGSRGDDFHHGGRGTDSCNGGAGSDRAARCERRLNIP